MAEWRAAELIAQHPLDMGLDFHVLHVNGGDHRTHPGVLSRVSRRYDALWRDKLSGASHPSGQLPVQPLAQGRKDEAGGDDSALEHTLRTGGDHVTEYRNVWPYGTVHWADVRARALRNTVGVLARARELQPFPNCPRPSPDSTAASPMLTQ